MSKKIQTVEAVAHIAVFQEKTIRRAWHNEEWWFSVVDVCGVLTESPDAGAYWRKLKQRLGAEGGEPVTFCHGLKLEAPDGKHLSSMPDDLVQAMLANLDHTVDLNEKIVGEVAL